MWKYIRYLGTHLLIALTICGLLLGGALTWTGLFATVLLWIGADALSDAVPDSEVPRLGWVLDVILYSFLPSIGVLCVAYAWSLSSHDLFGIGRTVADLTGFEILQRRSEMSLVSSLGASLSFAMAIALGAILTAHELVHRTRNAVAMFVGRWLLAMAWNATLEVAHVYGHHRDVGTAADPATARRGENVYRFAIRSTFGQVGQAWRIEMGRLRNASWPVRYLIGNKVTRGFLRSNSVAAFFAWAAGPLGLSMFVFASVVNKLVLEALNYIEHYGLVRGANEPYGLRHAWDTDRRVSHVVLLNLPRHSEHHLDSSICFQALERNPSSPLLPCGYLAGLLLSLFPPLWRKAMAAPLRRWDGLYGLPSGEQAGRI